MGEALRAWCEQVAHRDRADVDTATERAVRRLLRLTRDRIGTEITWLERISGDRIAVEFLDGDGGRFDLHEGTAESLKDSYSARVIDGRLPAIIPDTRADAATRGLVGTTRYRVGAYVGVPVFLRNGLVYGMLCCASDHPNRGLHPRDAATMAILAEMVADLVEPFFQRQARANAFRSEALAAVRAGAPSAVLQPIVELATGRTVVAEALARFPAGRYSTEQWFDAAHAAGAGTELETDAMTAALALLPRLPRDVRLAVNASSDMVASGAALSVLADGPPHRLIVEVTERHQSDDISRLVAAAAELRAHGVAIAIDDAGSGYSSLHQILQLTPDIVKLDRNLVTGVDTDPMKHALCRAFVAFTEEAGIMLVAEGVETAAEYAALKSLGVGHVQGYYVAPPRPVSVRGA